MKTIIKTLFVAILVAVFFSGFKVTYKSYNDGEVTARYFRIQYSPWFISYDVNAGAHVETQNQTEESDGRNKGRNI